MQRIRVCAALKLQLPALSEVKLARRRGYRIGRHQDFVVARLLERRAQWSRHLKNGGPPSTIATIPCHICAGR